MRVSSRRVVLDEIFPGDATGAGRLLRRERAGFAIDFTDMSMVVRDPFTPTNNFVGDPNSKLTYASPSTKWIRGADGLFTSGTTLRTEFDAAGNALGLRIEEARTNLFLNSRSPVTQNITTTAQSYTLSFVGTGSITLSGTGSGTLNGTGANNQVTLTFTATAGTLTVTCSGSLDFVQVEPGAFATSPIVTAGSTVTRAIDNISGATSLFPHSSAAGTYFVWASNRSTAGVIPTFLRDANILIGRVSTESRVYNGSTSGYLATIGSIVDDVFYKMAAGYTAGASASASARNGVLGGTFTNPANAATSLLIGNGLIGFGQAPANGYIRQVLFVPRRMSNSELQTVTT